jgi:UDP-N-acetylglucosamine 2-epimerase
MRIVHIVGTRPNFIKLSSVVDELGDVCENIIIHTGQHYDKNMSDVFFNDLKIEPPKYQLNIGGGGEINNLSKSLISISEILINEKPFCVVVYGDVTATLSGALCARKLNIPIVHVESGSRSFDRQMPEEINRVIVDNISDLLLCCDEESKINLNNEGISKNVYVVGNTAIDTFKKIYNEIKTPIINKKYVLCTLHRPFNVDNLEKLKTIISKLSEIPYTIIFPAHPRTIKNIKLLGNIPKNFEVINPLGYKDFINYLKYSQFVISDSGGIQSECASVSKRIITIRPSTEHLLSVNLGCNILCGDINKINKSMWETPIPNHKTPMVWDGMSSKRIKDIIIKMLENKL